MSYSIYLSLGSNIQPEANLTLAVNALRREFGDVLCSSVIETVAEGSSGPNFLNAAANFQTNRSIEDLKFSFLRSLESSMGRVRIADKNSPRQIDLDISIVDQNPLDQRIWSQVYLAVPLAELIPELIDPNSCKSLALISCELKRRAFWKERLDVDLNLPD
jgi:2-amino-4-hydroxy-6-hydroxymethyldihydropteridine diphosphokinase